MAFKCIIVDDEPPATRILENYIGKVSFLEKTEVFNDSLKALEFLNTQSVDVIFLDIQMPQLTGLQISRIISKDIKVIFTTAYPDFALEGFELNAVDYLLKPISFERFYQAVSKLNTQSKTVVSNQNNLPDFLFIKTDGKNKFQKVFLNDILYVESLQNYVCIHTSKQQIITHSSLKNVIESLPENNFIQIQKSYVVSLKHLESTDNYSVYINGKELPIGAAYKEAFFDKIEENKI
ncbi:LytR/AlgR family response regulator transcription factor [Flavobacterium johnsoniae]|jgi:DNA-binding LytR/AlgR family response regulator|uniref:Two component transcriptional regulator, LytTR family n=2 Tax=Flavobacterium johnsoniae TaxID=986 RepID=A0A1M7CAH9_FLAJO|nr:LytTR family DNA-binding domain-containing protein [Flavobacterium johnsoniae]ABQ05193.1 two component transcriptional regulator, LytTR family [Flavobacterium johnsoniae UW101]OXE96906.1 DNA-binding response regulator [Flavobacterium johnsoniae UW101]WQG83004.1 LytTR family DNA-binding domain-containing protein [Flavobacterium johnsoniae UW101]SHH06548.1 two component transcriptional regulator, LytTR family [Flavobacterium johnsoniae]SHL64288.1 two component transcriptional regulator, LytTR